MFCFLAVCVYYRRVCVCILLMFYDRVYMFCGRVYVCGERWLGCGGGRVYTCVVCFRPCVCTVGLP